MKRDRTANFQLQMQHSWILGYLGLRIKHPDPKRFSLVTNRTPNSSHAILFFWGKENASNHHSKNPPKMAKNIITQISVVYGLKATARRMSGANGTKKNARTKRSNARPKVQRRV